MSQSPQQASPTRAYENGLRAINRLIRENGSWSGHERNVLLRNNGGNFTDISGAVGLDLDQDGRAFVVTDYDRDGDPDIVVKSRTGPQLRLLRNHARNRNTSVALRLLGVESNRDATGATVTVQTESGKQTKMILGGSGFLSQHSKQLLFGLGEEKEVQRITIRWPIGNQQTLDSLPVNHHIVIEEMNPAVKLTPFRAREDARPGQSVGMPDKPSSPYAGTWLFEPYAAPDFSLTDLDGDEHRLSRYQGQVVLINFWATWCPPCRSELKSFQAGLSELESHGVVLLAVSVDEPTEIEAVKRFVRNHGLGFTVLPANDEMVRTYNLLSKYLFDKNQDLQIPTSFLLNAGGSVAKVYRGSVEVEQILGDVGRIPLGDDERFQAAIPFPGRFFGALPSRNYFRMGTALTEYDLVEPALAAFQQVTEVSPSAGQAFYNLGSLYLRKGSTASARAAFERALELLPQHAETHNNLGALSAEAGELDRAISHFKAALDSNPRNADALNNLGNAYMQRGRMREAREMFETALAVHPGYAEALNNLGIIFGEQGDLPQALAHFRQALEQRPDYPEAANNLALVHAAVGEIEQALRVASDSVQRNPDFEATYLTLAQLYLEAGRPPSAVRILQDLLARHPNHADAQAMLSMLREMGVQ